MGYDRPFHNEEWLREKYHGEGLTLTEMGEMCGVTGTSVANWMERHGIERRGAHARRVPWAGFYTTKPYYDENGHYEGSYEEWTCQEPDGSTAHVKVHRLLAVAEYGFDSVVGNDVHHANGVGWDNRPGNIEVMSREEHLSAHGESESWYSHLHQPAENVR